MLTTQTILITKEQAALYFDALDQKARVDREAALIATVIVAGHGITGAVNLQITSRDSTSAVIIFPDPPGTAGPMIVP